MDDVLERARRAEARADADRDLAEEAISLAADAVDRVPRRRREDLEARLDELRGLDDEAEEHAETT